MNIDNFLIANDLKDPFDILQVFEKKLSEFFGSPYAVLTDCCTHAIELCLRLEPGSLLIPKQTYVSIPMTAIKLQLPFEFRNIAWTELHQLKPNLYDAATLWRPNSYIPGSKMCVSFQQKKHINIGRGGCILLDNCHDYNMLKRMRYDGRDPSKKNENISFLSIPSC
jgi:dTDP-4-amino-4,6-dideoxygalactose transaminase